MVELSKDPARQDARAAVEPANRRPFQRLLAFMAGRRAPMAPAEKAHRDSVRRRNRWAIAKERRVVGF
jgi:hypothetical protein